MPRDGAAATPDGDDRRQGGTAARRLIQAGSMLALLAMFAGFGIAAPGFLGAGNLANIVGQVAVIGVQAIGLTFVVVGGGNDIVRGGIDLSVANTLGLCAAVFATLVASTGDGVALAAALATGLAVGAVNAVSVIWLGILPLLATLAVMNVCAGLELVLTHNTVVAAQSPLLAALAGEFPAGVPVLAYGLLAVAFVAFVALHLTPAGLRLNAVGGHREAARAAGLSIPAHVAASYLASGLCAALAAVLSVALLSGSTTGSGDMLLSVVATALLGAVFSRRLVATIGGTLLSALFIGMLTNGFQLLNVSSYWVNGVEGVLILLVVGVTSALRREVR